MAGSGNCYHQYDRTNGSNSSSYNMTSTAYPHTTIDSADPFERPRRPCPDGLAGILPAVFGKWVDGLACLTMA